MISDVLQGPYEITFALCNTKDAYLGGVGEGWAEPFSGFTEARGCDESNLQLVRILADWPSKQEIQELAFSVGNWIEDAWGMDCRRYLARQGGLSGEFDINRYRA